RAVNFICRDEHRLVHKPGKLSKLFIERGDARARVNKQNYQRRFVECRTRLNENVSRYQILLIWDDAAGIDQPELPSPPLGPTINPIARYSRLVTDDGPSRAGQLVKQRRLAHVWASEYADRWKLIR